MVNFFQERAPRSPREFLKSQVVVRHLFPADSEVKSVLIFASFANFKAFHSNFPEA